MRHPIHALGLFALLSLLPLAAVADDVYLVNGQVFEGVVAETIGDRVHVQLEFGRISLPLAQVERVVEATTPLEHYEQRRRELEASLDASAEEWLQLARFAGAHGNVDGQRAAALVAAALDPSAPGLEPVMVGLGYALDEGSERWLPEAEVMHRRGFVRYDGEWLSEPEARRRQQERERTLALAPAVQPIAPALESRGPTDNEVMLAQVEVLRDMVDVLDDDREREAVPRRQVPWVWGSFLGAGVGGGVPATPQARATWNAMAIRQAGSVLPVRQFEDR